MSEVYRSNRKASDADIIRLNSVGLSLSTIAEKLNCNPSTITQRLHALKIRPADTRRAFMEDIYHAMTPDQQGWLEGQLGGHISVKDYIKNLLMKEFIGGNQPGATQA